MKIKKFESGMLMVNTFPNFEKSVGVPILLIEANLSDPYDPYDPYDHYDPHAVSYLVYDIIEEKFYTLYDYHISEYR